MMPKTKGCSGALRVLISCVLRASSSAAGGGIDMTDTPAIYQTAANGSLGT